MIKKFQSINLFWRLNLLVLLFFLAVAPICYLMDNQLFTLINQDAAHSYLDEIVEFINHHGLTILFVSIVVPLACLNAYSTSSKNSMKKAIMLLLILLLIFLAFYLIRYITVDMIKETVQRPRPYLELEARVISPLSAWHDYRSFPSETASSSFYVFSAIIYLLYKSREGMKLPRYLITVVIIYSFALALLRALCKIYLGHHYPSDIVCGAILGLLFSIAIVMGIERVRAKRILHLIS